MPLGSASSGSSSDPCSTANTAVQTAYSYASDYVAGTPTLTCMEDQSSTTVYRAQQRNTIAPPHAPILQMGVTGTGQVYYSTLQLDPGGTPSSNSLGQREVAAPLYWLEVPRDAHNCRHVSNANCQ